MSKLKQINEQIRKECLRFKTDYIRERRLESINEVKEKQRLSFQLN